MVAVEVTVIGSGGVRRLDGGKAWCGELVRRNEGGREGGVSMEMVSEIKHRCTLTIDM